MREFSVSEIETYATRAQACACFAAAINALGSIIDLNIFSPEEQETLKGVLDAILETSRANAARIEITEESFRKFQVVKPSQKALVALMDLLEGLKEEVEADTKPNIPMQSNPRFEGDHE